jgi:hypothetical protein
MLWSKRSTSRGFRLSIALAGAVVLAAGCRCDQSSPPRIEETGVVRCERGVQRVTAENDMQAAMRIYYTECSTIHAELGCRQAFLSAAQAKPEDQIKVIAEGCKAAYCPILGSEGLELCKPGVSLTPEVLQATWPPFHNAVVAYDTGRFAPRVQKALLIVYAHAMKLAAKTGGKAPADAAAPAASASGDAAVAASAAGSAMPAPSGSAAEGAAQRPTVPVETKSTKKSAQP